MVQAGLRRLTLPSPGMPANQQLHTRWQGHGDVEVGRTARLPAVVLQINGKHAVGQLDFVRAQFGHVVDREGLEPRLRTARRKEARQRQNHPIAESRACVKLPKRDVGSTIHEGGIEKRIIEQERLSIWVRIAYGHREQLAKLAIEHVTC